MGRQVSLVLGDEGSARGRVGVSRDHHPLSSPPSLHDTLSTQVSSGDRPIAGVRRWLLVAYAMLLVALIAGSYPRTVGDGGEYLAMASQFAALQMPTVQIHFWLYSLLASPAVGLTQLLGVSPVHGFTVTNLALLGAAFAVVTTRVNWPVAALIFTGPIVWWVDKPHTEVLTFTMLAVGLAVWKRTPWWSLVTFGVAAAQNIAAAPIVPLAAGLSLVERPRHVRDHRWWLGVAAGSTVLLMSPVYYQLRVGSPVPLLVATHGGWPNLGEIGLVLWDLNLGIVPAFPVWAALLAVGVARAIAHLRLCRPDVDQLLAGVAGLVFLGIFAQTSNFNHGGTPSLSRYGVWLIPLSLPFLRTLAAGVTGPRWLAMTAVASCIWSGFVFHPGRPESHLSATAVARHVWTRYPALSNPVPEVYVERLRGTDGNWFAPVTTPGCEKVLLIGRPDFNMWPRPCAPAEVPAACQAPGALCYANLVGRRYVFAPVPPPSFNRYKFDRDIVWPRSVERVVARQLHELRWWELDVARSSGDGSALRAISGMERAIGWHGADRLFLFMEETTSAPSVVLRVNRRMVGWFLDPETGGELGAAVVEPAREPYAIKVPPNRRHVALVLLAESGPSEGGAHPN